MKVSQILVVNCLGRAKWEWSSRGQPGPVGGEADAKEYGKAKEGCEM